MSHEDRADKKMEIKRIYDKKIYDKKVGR